LLYDFKIRERKKPQSERLRVFILVNSQKLNEKVEEE
jgi:hypothetical protein